jgi:hypothetical protein
MPGREYVGSIRDFWRVCSGCTQEAKDRTVAFLSSVLNTRDFPLTVMDRPIESETTKIVENSCRATILAFLNEWSLFAERNGVDLVKVINAIKVRPPTRLPRRRPRLESWKAGRTTRGVVSSSNHEVRGREVGNPVDARFWGRTAWNTVRSASRKRCTGRAPGTRSNGSAAASPARRLSGARIAGGGDGRSTSAAPGTRLAGARRTARSRTSGPWTGR